jgi:transcriptional regulator with XRE-family HTH domain
MKKRSLFPSLAAYLDHLDKLGKNQADFAEGFGISVGYLSDLKNGKATPSLALLKRFRDECGIAIDSFLNETLS